MTNALGYVASVLASPQRGESEEAHGARELPLDPIFYGVIAFGVLVLLLLITMSFNRHR